MHTVLEFMFCTCQMQARAIKDLQCLRRRKSTVTIMPDTSVADLEKDLEMHKTAATAQTKIIELQASSAQKDDALILTIQGLNATLTASIDMKDRIIAQLEKKSATLAEHVKELESSLGTQSLDKENQTLRNPLAAKTPELEDLQVRSKVREETMGEIKTVYTDFKERLEALLASDDRWYSEEIELKD